MLSRAVMVKDEKHYDRFDRAYADYFKGLETLDPDWLSTAIPEDWLRKQTEKRLSPERASAMEGPWEPRENPRRV